jgi:GntP family gluconate:H+ symporter
MILNPWLVAGLLLVSICTIVLLSSRYKWNTFFVLLMVAMLVGLFAGFSGEDVIGHIKVGFGHTLEKIGLLIILGTTLGIILDKTHATLSLANYILQKTGEQNAGLAMTLIGFVIGLPIFCDSGFIVLSGLLFSISKQVQKSHILLTICLAGALYAVHCLVPPHPGITAAAGQMGVDLGTTMLLGTLLAIPSTVGTYFWAKYANTHFSYNDPIVTDSTNFVPSKTILPHPLTAFLPIIVPIILIALKSLLLLNPVVLSPQILHWTNFLGEPVVALCVGIVFSMSLFPKIEKVVLNKILEESIEKAGPILAIIAIGGAFGEVIKMLDLGKVFGQGVAELGMGLFIPFVLTVIFKTAQGSSTVAIISATSICLPLLPSLGLTSDWDKQLALLAMGAGSMMISHANDAYFWVVSRFGKLETSLALRTYSVMSCWMSLITFAGVYILYCFFR